jgi:outer membrane protein assembly factor BamB
MRKVSCLLFFLLLSAGAFAQAHLLWEVQEDFKGGIDLARAVTLSKKTTVVVGTADAPGGELDFVIQALRRATGTVQWTDQVSSCCGSTSVHIASLRDKIFAAGYTAGAQVSSTDMVVRAYHAPSGTLLWENIWDAGQDDLPNAIEASETAVVVVGSGGNGPQLDFLVRAFDPVSGAVLWEDQVDRPDFDSVAWAVATDWNRVFVAGTTSSTSDPSQRDLLLRSYIARSGELSWEVTRPSTFPSKLKVLSGRVFLAGSSSTPTYVGAYAAKSGVLLWEDNALVPGFFSDMAVKGRRLVVAGSSGRGLLVRAYDVRNGTMEWEDQPPVLPGFGEFAAAVDLNSEAVYIAGSSGKNFEYSEAMVRAYDAGGGSLLWDARSHRSLMSAAVDVALGRNRLFVAGYTTTGTSTNFLIQAYDVRQRPE